MEVRIALDTNRQVEFADGAIGVLPTINLDDETLLATDEVGVIRPKRLLARELQPAETTIAKCQPQDPFGPCAPPPQRASISAAPATATS